MTIRLQLPKVTELKPRITVVGVGGAGGNAVNNMIAAGLNGVTFVVANTDAQALASSSAEHRIQLGANLTEGLGAGSKPEIGQAAAEEAIDEIKAQLANSHMLFIAAGMGGGTGSGAAAIIARVARELGVLTVAVVTKPFNFEGQRRMRIAEAAIEQLADVVDTLIVIPNQNLFRITTEKTTFAEAFVLADQVLYSGIACIVDLIMKDGLINLDLADVRTVLSGMGSAMMGTGEASGEDRAELAAREAIANPLLDDISLAGAKGLLVSIIGGHDLTLFEVDKAATRVRQEVDPDANIIVGATFDQSLGDRVRVSIVASGMKKTSSPSTADPATSNRVPSHQHAPPPEPTSPPRSIHQTLAEQKLPPPLPPVPPAPPEPSRPRAELDRRLAEAEEPGPGLGGQFHGPLPQAASSNFAQHASKTGKAHEPIHRVGDVVVTERLPDLTEWNGRPDGQPAESSAEPARPASAAMPPAAPPRTPALSDFPPIGQQAYRGGTARTPTPPPLPRTADSRAGKPPAEQKKPSLFQRLTHANRPTPEVRNDPQTGDGALPDFLARKTR